MPRRDEYEPSGILSNTASPGFSFSKQGNVNSGTYLLNGTNISSVTPKYIFLTDAELLSISVNSSQPNTCVIAVEEYDGVSFTEIDTITLTAEQGKEKKTNISITKGYGLAVKVKSGSIKDPDVVLVISGVYE